jgi:hypothetical protein
MPPEAVSVRAEVEKTLADAFADGTLTSLDRALTATTVAVATCMDAALTDGTPATVSQLSSRMLYLLRELGLTPKSRIPKVEAGPLETFLNAMQSTPEPGEEP